MILQFKGTLVKKEQKKKKDGSPSAIYLLTFNVGGETITLDGFGDRATEGETYGSIDLELKDREYQGRLYSNLFVRNLANPEGNVQHPDPEPNYDQPDSGTEDTNDDLPF